MNNFYVGIFTAIAVKWLGDLINAAFNGTLGVTGWCVYLFLSIVIYTVGLHIARTNTTLEKRNES